VQPISDAQWKRWFGRATSISGLGGIIYTLITHGTAQPTLLIILGMFAGLPLALGVDGVIRAASTLASAQQAQALAKPAEPPTPPESVEAP
jgi:hypothetical protein